IAERGGAVSKDHTVSRPPSPSASRLLGWGFVAPALSVLLAMNVFPLVYNIYLSFTNADLSSSAVQNIGTRNYALVFAEGRYADALTTTALFVVLSVSIELVLGFVLRS